MELCSNAAFDNLNVGGGVSDTFTVTSADGTTTTVKVTINGTNDAAVITGLDSGLVDEDFITTVSGILTATDPDDPELFQIDSGESDNGYGTFVIDENGAWTYTIDNNNPDRFSTPSTRK